MSLISTNAASINAQVAGIARELDRIFLRAEQMKAWLDTLSDAQLIALYGYVQGDIDVLRSAVADMNILRTVYEGAATQGSLKDFRTFAKQMYPFGSL